MKTLPCLFLAALSLFALPAEGATLSWLNSGTGSWFTGTNWSGGTPPTSSDTASVANGGTAQVVAGGTATVDQVSLSGGSKLQVTGGLLTYQTVNRIDGGSIETLSGGTVQGFNSTQVGRTGVGTLNINGGLLYTTTSGGLNIGFASTSSGTVNITSGTADFTDGSVTGLAVGAAGTGALNLSGGALKDFRATIGDEATAKGTVLVSGGTWANEFIEIGNSGSGAVTVSGGLVQAIGGGGTTITIAKNAGSVGTLTISGSSGNRGLVQTSGIVSGSGTANLIFNGGVLTAVKNNSSFLTGFTTGGVVIQGGGAYIDSNGFNIGISSVLSGSGALIKQSSGTLTLSGTNSYTGGTVIEGGVVSVSANRNLGANAGSVTLNGGTLQAAGTFSANRATVLNVGGGVFDVTSGNTLTWQGAISGTGGFGKTGAGTMVLSGSSTYAGATLVSGGTLAAGAANAFNANSAFTVNSGAALSLANFNQAIGSLSGTGIVSLGSATLTTGGDDTDTTFAGTIQGTGGLTKRGTGVFTLSGSNTYSGTTTVNRGSLRAGAVNAFSAASALNIGANGTVRLAGFDQTVASLAGAGSVRLGGGTLTTGDAGNSTFSGDIAGAGGLIKVGAGTFTLSGTLNTYTGTTQVAAGTLAAGAVNAFSASSAMAVNSGALLDLAGYSQNISSLSGAGTVALGSGTLTTGSDGTDTTFSGAIGGTGGLVKTGTGVFTLSGSNTYTGTTRVAAGVLRAGANNAFSSASAVAVDSGAIVRLAGFNQAVDSLTGSGRVTLGGGVLTVGGAGSSSEFSGSITGNGGLVKTGTGIFTLSGSNGYNASTTVTGGEIRAGSANAFSNDSAFIVGTSGTLNLADFNETIGSISGSGAVLLGTGTLTAGRDGTNTDFAGSISGTGALVKVGTGTLTLSGSNSQLGGTGVTKGTLVVTNVNALSSAALVDGANAVLQINANGVMSDITARDGGTVDNFGTLSGTNGLSLRNGGILINEAGALVQHGVTGRAGPVQIFNSGTITGGVDLRDFDNAVTLVAGSHIGGKLDIGVSTGASLTLTGTVDQLYSDAVSGTTAFSGNLVKTGAAKWTVDRDLGNVTNVSIQEGYLQLGNDDASGSLGSAGIDIGANGAFIIKRSDTISLGNVLTGSGQLVQMGAGTTQVGPNAGFSGTTFVNQGRLQTFASNALGSGPLYLNGGDLNPLGELQVSALTWNSGTISMGLGQSSSSTISVTGTFSGNPGREFSFYDTGDFAPGTYSLITFGDTTYLDPSVFSGLMAGLQAEFSLTGTSLLVTFTGTSTSGSTLSNNSAPYTSTTANFDVDGNVQTSNAPNVVNSLTFKNNSFLSVFNVLTISSGNFFVNNGSASIGGPGTVVTPGDFTKFGGGLLKLLGEFIAFGNANINGGGLSVNGTLTADNVFVQLGAYLKGGGIIFGNVFNSGVVAPGNSPGTLTINGNFTQTSSGALQIELASPTVFDRLIVSGNAQLAGQLQVLSYGGYKFKYGQQFAFLQAGSISGKFDSIVTSNPSTFRARFIKNGGIGSILIAPTSYALVAQNQNQRNVAKALNSYITAGGDKEVVSTALDFLTADQYPSAFEQIMPGFYESLGNITVEQANSQSQFIAQRMSAVKLGARGFSTVGIAASLVHDKDGKSVMDAKDGKNILAPTPDNKWGVWVQGNGVFARAQNVSNVPNYHYESGGFFTGIDYKWSENLTTGVYTGYQGLYSKYNGGGLTTINSALFGGYATYQVGGFYADAIIGGGYNGYVTRRTIKFGSINRSANAEPNGGQFTAYADLGYDWKVKGFTFGPILSGQYTYAGVTPFTERDANSLNLRVEQQNINSLRMNVGGRVAYTWNVTEKITLIPEGRLFWQHEFLENPRNISASLDGGSGPGFDYSTSAPDRDSVWAGAGISAQFGDRWNANFYYNANFGRDDFVSHMISGGLGVSF